MIVNDKNYHLSNSMLGDNRFRVLTVGQIKKLLVGLPNETLLGIETGEKCGSILSARIDTFRPVKKSVPNDAALFYEYIQTPKCWEGSDVLVLTASLPEFIAEKKDEVLNPSPAE
jgi:hypothetical protein